MAGEPPSCWALSKGTQPGKPHHTGLEPQATRTCLPADCPEVTYLAEQLGVMPAQGHQFGIDSHPSERQQSFPRKTGLSNCSAENFCADVRPQQGVSEQGTARSTRLFLTPAFLCRGRTQSINANIAWGLCAPT